MVGTDQDGQAGDVGGAEQHHVQAPSLKAIASPWAAKEKAAHESNNALDWTPVDLLQSVANRLRSGAMKADKAVIVLVDTATDEATVCAAGTLSDLEQRGILISAAVPS